MNQTGKKISADQLERLHRMRSGILQELAKTIDMVDRYAETLAAMGASKHTPITGNRSELYQTALNAAIELTIESVPDGRPGELVLDSAEKYLEALGIVPKDHSR